MKYKYLFMVLSISSFAISSDADKPSAIKRVLSVPTRHHPLRYDCDGNIIEVPLRDSVVTPVDKKNAQSLFCLDLLNGHLDKIIVCDNKLRFHGLCGLMIDNGFTKAFPDKPLYVAGKYTCYRAILHREGDGYVGLISKKQV